MELYLPVKIAWFLFVPSTGIHEVSFSYRSPDLLFRVATAAGSEVRGKHNDFVRRGIYASHTGASCFSPVINIARDPRWGRNQVWLTRPFIVFIKCMCQGLEYVKVQHFTPQQQYLLQVDLLYLEYVTVQYFTPQYICCGFTCFTLCNKSGFYGTSYWNAENRLRGDNARD